MVYKVVDARGVRILLRAHVKNLQDGLNVKFFVMKTNRDLCKTPPFAQLLRQAQILILEIFNIFLRLKFSPSLYLNKIGHFSKVSNNNERPVLHRSLVMFMQSYVRS